MRERDGDQELSDLLGIARMDLYRTLGRGWRRADDVADDGFRTWFVTGQPSQIAVGVDGLDVVLARTLWRWDGPGTTRLHPADQQAFPRDDVWSRREVVTEAAAEIASRRRRSFRWCSACRSLTPPESFVRSEGCCMSCHSELNGVVY